MFLFFFDICHPVLRNAHIKCEHHNLLPQNLFLKIGVSDAKTRVEDPFIAMCTLWLRAQCERNLNDTAEKWVVFMTVTTAHKIKNELHEITAYIRSLPECNVFLGIPPCSALFICSLYVY